MAKNGRLPTPFLYRGLYYVRRRVPKDLRPFFKGEVVMRSLMTRDPVEAARKFPAANTAVEAQFASVRQSNGTWPVDRGEQERRFDQMIDGYMAQLSEIDRRMLNFAFQHAAPFAFEFDNQFDDWPTPDRSRFARSLAESAAEFASKMPLPLPIRDAFNRHVELGLRGYVRAIHRPMFDASSEARKFTPEEPELDLSISLSGLQPLWEEARKPSVSSVAEMTLTIRDFVDVYGNIPAAEVTRTDIEDFKRRLARLPKRLSRSERALPLTERENLPGTKLTAATVGKKITLLKGLLSFAHKDAKLLPVNAGSGIATGSKQAGATRDQFTPDEVTRIFELPLFRDPANWLYDRSVSDVTLAWLFLFGLTSGPRLTETGQAETADVVSQGSIRALQITDELSDEGVTPEDKTIPDKSLKTEASRRYIVISPMLINLGFDRFLDALRRAGASQLFPDLWRDGGPCTKEASRLLNRRIDRVSRRRHLCFHSLRHTWKAAARDAGTNEMINRQLSGHRPRDESEKYGPAYLPTLAKHAARMKFRMIDWADLACIWSTIDWDDVVGRLLESSRSCRKRRRSPKRAIHHLLAA